MTVMRPPYNDTVWSINRFSRLRLKVVVEFILPGCRCSDVTDDVKSLDLNF